MMSRSLIHLFVALGVLAGAVGVYGFWLYQVKQEAAASLALQSQIDATIEAAVVAAETGDALAELAGDEAVIEGYRIRLDGIVAFLERIEGTGRTLGSSVEVVAVADKPSADGRIALTVRVLGSFDAVMRTLGAIEYGPYDIRVENLTFDTPTTSGAWTAAVALSVAVDAAP